MKARILFACTANSARSQMAEGLARTLVPDGVEVASGGTNPAAVHPFAVAVMREHGIDISQHRSKAIAELRGAFDYVITLCDAAAQHCPAVPGSRRAHWPLPDPGAANGDDASRLAVFRRVRDEIELRLREFLKEENLLAEEPGDPLVRAVRAELCQYEHPLFAFEAVPAGEEVEVQIRLRRSDEEAHAYAFRLGRREIEQAQFPWNFERQLYDCLHDYVIEMFTRNPQRKN